jgi:hypothetical protein
VRAALVERPSPFVVARATVDGVCPVAGPVLCRTIERVVGLPVVVATPRAGGGWLLYGSEEHVPAATALRFGELAWVDLAGEA